MTKHDLFDDSFRLSHALHRRLTQLGEWADTADLCRAVAVVQARLTEAERDSSGDDDTPRHFETDADTGIGVGVGVIIAAGVYLLIGLLIWRWFAS